MPYLSKISLACACAWAACIASNVGSVVHAQFPETQLRVIYPPVAQIGTTANVDVLGQGPLEEIDRLIFSHAGMSANVVPGESDPLTGATRKQFGKFTLSIASDVPPGFYEVWAVGRNGASSSRIVWVTARPLLAAVQPADPKLESPALTLDGMVVDRFVAAKSQRYALTLAAGQSVRISVLDTKLDSRALAHIRVVGPNGQAVASARSVGIEGAMAAFTAEQAGVFKVELRDSIYRGGDEYFYAMWVESAEAPRTDLGKAIWKDRASVLAALLPATGQLSKARQAASLGLGHWLAQEIPFLHIESAARPAKPLAAPMVVSGAFDSDPSGQAFDIDAKKGEVYWIDIASEQLGESTDPHLSVYKAPPSEAASGSAEALAAAAASPAVVAPVPAPASAKAPATPAPADAAVAVAAAAVAASVPIKLERVAEQDDAPPFGSVPFLISRADPSLRFEAPADGRYRIVIRDQLANSADRAGGRFLLAIRKPQPGLALLAAWQTPINNMAQSRATGSRLQMGGTSTVRVIVNRIDGLAGPVEVFCEGLPAGVTASPILIAADRAEGHLVLVNHDQPTAFVGPVQIIGRSTIDPNMRAQATAVELTWEAIPSWNALSHRRSQQLVAAVSDQDLHPLTLQVGTAEILPMARGGKLPVPIKIVRRAGGSDKIVLRPQALPTKTTMAEVAVEGAVAEGMAELVIAPDAPSGEATFWLQGETKVKIRNNPQAFDRAEAERVVLEKMLADPAKAEQKDAITAALKAATDNVAKLKELTAEKEVTVFVPSNTLRVKIVDGPLEAASPWQATVKRSVESDHPVGIKRLFGFNEAIAVTLVAEPGSAGLELTSATIAQGAAETVLHFKVAADAPLGERKLQIKLAYKFNNQDLSLVLPLLVTVAE